MIKKIKEGVIAAMSCDHLTKYASAGPAICRFVTGGDP